MGPAPRRQRIRAMQGVEQRRGRLSQIARRRQGQVAADRAEPDDDLPLAPFLRPQANRHRGRIMGGELTGRGDLAGRDVPVQRMPERGLDLLGGQPALPQQADRIGRQDRRFDAHAASRPVQHAVHPPPETGQDMRRAGRADPA